MFAFYRVTAVQTAKPRFRQSVCKWDLRRPPPLTRGQRTVTVPHRNASFRVWSYPFRYPDTASTAFRRWDLRLPRNSVTFPFRIAYRNAWTFRRTHSSRCSQVTLHAL